MANQKMSEEELNRIKALQEGNQSVIRELGEIEVIRINLEARRENAMKYMEDLKTEEANLGKELSEKYGDGTVDLGTGEFVPTASEEEIKVS